MLTADRIVAGARPRHALPSERRGLRSAFSRSSSAGARHPARWRIRSRKVRVAGPDRADSRMTEPVFRIASGSARPGKRSRRCRRRDLIPENTGVCHKVGHAYSPAIGDVIGWAPPRTLSATPHAVIPRPRLGSNRNRQKLTLTTIVRLQSVGSRSNVGLSDSHDRQNILLRLTR